jgi:antirestriction protein ArdC
MPWHTTGADRFAPANAATGKPYRGVNVVALWIAAEAAGYSSGSWATYRQWTELGAQVRRGEKSSAIVFWRPVDARKDPSPTEDQPTDPDTAPARLFARLYHVFNADQVDGWTGPAEAHTASPADRIETAERFFAAIGADIRHGGNQAGYLPKADYIVMPPFERFDDPVSYYSTLAHEATHWTGHSSRMARDLSLRFRSDAYAAEELIAELGAAFLCGTLGLSAEPRPDHAAYIAGWLQVLRNDPKAIVTASSKAQQAVDFLVQRQCPDDSENEE